MVKNFDSIEYLSEFYKHKFKEAKQTKFSNNFKTTPNLEKVNIKDIEFRDINISKYGLTKEIKKGNESEYTNISNFVPYVSEEIIVHSTDYYPKRMLSVGVYIEGIVHEPVTLPSTQFAKDRWLKEYFPFACKINSKYDYLYEYLQDCSRKVPKVNKYSYIGWANDLDWTYLYYGGAISKEERSDITLTSDFNKFELEYFVVTHSPKACLRHLKHKMFRIMNKSYVKIMISFLLLSLTTSKFAEFAPEFIMLIFGQTGTGKTTIAKLIFGIFKGFYDNAPMNLSITTSAAMEQNGIIFKDCVCLYDDIPPADNPTNRAENREKVDKLARSTGDRTGRQKMEGNKSLNNKPTGLSAVTAEYVPIDIPSSVARSLIMHFDGNDFDYDTYLEAKQNNSKYINFIIQYIEYIATYGNDYMDRLNKYYKEAYCLFENLSEIHGRTPNTAAWLYAAYKMFLEYAGTVSDEIFGKKELEYYKDDLVRLMKEQKQYMTDQDSIDVFVNSLKEMLESKTVSLGEIVVEDKKNTARTSSNQIGFIDKKYVYLLPTSTFGKINMFLKQNNKVLPITESTLYKYLDNKGMLEKNKSNKGCKTVKLSVNGKRHNVLKLKASLFYDEDISEGQ